MLQSLVLAAAGRFDLALDRLARERDAITPAGRFATALTFALTDNWPGLLQWVRRDFAVTANPAIFSLYLRALGESGALDDLVLQVSSESGEREGRLTSKSSFRFHRALVLAFCGRTRAWARLAQNDLRLMPRAWRQFWRATAELAEGQPQVAREGFRKLRAESPDAWLRRSAERRMALGGMPLTLSPASEFLLDRLVTESIGERGAGLRRGWRSAPAVWALIAINLAVFGLELLGGGAENPATLAYLGALEPVAVIVRHEYWRLLSAIFLHYGPLHLAINLLALAILGPPLERLIGSARFVVGYLLSGLGSSAGIVLLALLGLTRVDQLVGASGAIMGVIGLSAGLLLRHRPWPLASRQLRNILAIVAIQTVFDLWTPQVSLAAHLGGFVSGVGIGVIFAVKDQARLEV